MKCTTIEKRKEQNNIHCRRRKIDYPGEVATPTEDTLVAKILFNSIISTKGAKFMTINISTFYLMTPLKLPEYIHIHVRDTPDEIIKEYKLK